jgi:cell division protein FtsN
MPGRGESPRSPEVRTVSVILLAGLGAVVMAFVLGINVGLDRTLPENPAAESHVLRTLDSQAARLRQVRAQERTELSFHDTLTAPARPPRAPATTAALTASHPPATSSTAGAPATPSPEAALLATATAPSVAASAEPTSSSDGAAGRGEDPDEESAAPTSRFSLQVGAFPDETSAAGLRLRLQQKGYQVRIATSEVEGRGTWYRVRVGSYADRTAAEDQRTQLSSSEGLFALVVPET